MLFCLLCFDQSLPSCARSNADVEAQIAHLRAELLHKEQENERVQAALAREVEERARAERQACRQGIG